MQLSNKVALITGSGAGLGQACALLFAEEGAKIVIADINRKAAKETVELTKRKVAKLSLLKRMYRKQETWQG